MNYLLQQTAAALAQALSDGNASSTAICEALLGAVERGDSSVGAFLHLDAAAVLAAAAASDARRAAGKALSRWDGLPIGLKDNIAVAGQPLTCASRMLAPFVSPYDATVTRRLTAAGLIPFGRLNLDEFAMGSSTENSAFQLTRNPWNTDHAPGGSSGGSAAAVAARFCPWALGSDTGGSIRQPAAFCGVIGLKPTYGRVSRFGLVAFASSLDQIGPIGRSVADVAALLDLIAGPDEADSTSWPHTIPPSLPALDEACPPMVIGIPDEYFADGMEAEVRAALEAVMETYRQAGHTLRRIQLPHTRMAVAAYYIIATAEASSNLARYDGVRYGHRSAAAADAVEQVACSRGEGFGAEVKRRIILGSYVLSSGYYDAWYKRAQQVRARIRDDFLQAFSGVDAILTPTTPTAAFRIGEKSTDPLAMYLADIYTIPANLAGLPALSIPCGLNEQRLPLAFQLIGRPYAEAQLLAIAREYERAHPFVALPPMCQTQHPSHHV